MDETANQIEAHINRTRERLGSNLRELEDRVEAATDWREHFRERPHVFVGAAFVGGMVLAGVLRSKSAQRPLSGVATQPSAGRAGSVHAQARDLWNNVQVALVGVASEQIRSYISEMVPGFADHYRRAEERAPSAPRPVYDASRNSEVPD